MLAIDIDDTLCVTTAWRMELFQERFGNPEQMDPQAMVEKYEVVEHVPYRQLPEAKKLRDQLLLDNHAQIDLPVFPFAAEAVTYINAHLTPIMYVTARSERIREGSLARLQENKFPDAPLIMMPADYDSEQQFNWKAEYLMQNHAIKGIIDNSKTLMQNLENQEYHGTTVLYGHPLSVHHPVSAQLHNREHALSLTQDLSSPLSQLLTNKL